MVQVFAWLKENSNLLSTLLNLGMLLVWFVYLQIFVQNFLRQRRPRVMIHQTQGYDADATCLLVNMSQELIHILCVMVVVLSPRGPIIREVTDYRHISAEEQTPRELENIIKQGPLSPGSFISLGTFGGLLKRIAADRNATVQTAKRDGDVRVNTLEIRVVAMYGSEDRPVGAYRQFSVSDCGAAVRPTTLDTKQMASRVERREVKQWLKTCMEL